MVKMLE
jgi:hypothetical protein